ncbi:MAG: hypothetical protein AAF655_19035 [Bacteroidota bacterium]
MFLLQLATNDVVSPEINFTSNISDFDQPLIAEDYATNVNELADFKESFEGEEDADARCGLLTS